MNLEIFIMAFEALFANKTRTALSMLGIVIGVSTIILVVGIGLGAQKDIEEQYKNLSVTSIMVNPVNTGNSPSKLSSDDVDYILEQGTSIEGATAMVQGKLPTSYGKESEQFNILGVEENFFELSNLEFIEGKAFTEEEVKNRAKILIIGADVVDELFAGDHKKAIGETVSVGGKKLEVVGTIMSSGSSIGPITFDDSVYSPISTAEKNILGTSATVRLIVLATSIDTIGDAMDELSVLLRANHKLKDSNPDDFKLKDQGSKVTAAQESAKTMSALLTAVASIVLVVSGIGIMNVMFVTVAERTKEIGIIKAIGGKRKDILMQFLMEAFALSFVAGVIGISLGQAAIPFINKLDDWNIISSVNGVVIAFLFSIFVGVFFGFYPALKASKLDPVDALRSE
jgi:putative ABC transport system permease protein